MPPVFSSPLYPSRLVLTGIVTLASGVQLVLFARRVFFARERFGIEYPAVSGNPDFERVFRAQQNNLEWYPIFMSALWTSSIFFSQVPSAICGVIYLIGRQRYFNGYSRSVEGRLPGFQTGLRCLYAMAVMGAVGMGLTVVSMVLHHRGHSLPECPHFWALRSFH